MCEDERVQEWVREAVETINSDLESTERVKEFVLVPDEWTADDDLLTPSMKKKRRNIRNEYEDAIAQLYGEKAAAD